MLPGARHQPYNARSLAAGGYRGWRPPGRPIILPSRDTFTGAACRADALWSPPKPSGKSGKSIYCTSKFISRVRKPLCKQISFFSRCLRPATLHFDSQPCSVGWEARAAARPHPVPPGDGTWRSSRGSSCGLAEPNEERGAWSRPRPAQAAPGSAGLPPRMRQDSVSRLLDAGSEYPLAATHGDSPPLKRVPSEREI